MEKKEKLEQLKKRNEELKLIVFKSFKTDKELDKYEKENQKNFDEYFDNYKQIETLKWELMPQEERAKEEEIIKKMKLKREGKL